MDRNAPSSSDDLKKLFKRRDAMKNGTFMTLIESQTQKSNTEPRIDDMDTSSVLAEDSAKVNDRDDIATSTLAMSIVEPVGDTDSDKKSEPMNTEKPVEERLKEEESQGVGGTVADSQAEDVPIKLSALRQMIKSQPLTSIVRLNLSENRLSNLVLPVLPALRELNLSNNSFKKVPSILTSLTSLTKLDISNNHLKSLSVLKHIPSLRLVLSHEWSTY